MKPILTAIVLIRILRSKSSIARVLSQERFPLAPSPGAVFIK